MRLERGVGLCVAAGASWCHPERGLKDSGDVEVVTGGVEERGEVEVHEEPPNHGTAVSLRGG